ncbi:MAG TPA: type II toxin-antitoxin system PemK/MazF family toxin [Pelobium sp.]|nr:type II toxin-antitoxin system PemK/MazF family toxin [Pelobium sp.]
MKQGEIWYASLDPTKGSEQAGYSPVVILSGNMLNQIFASGNYCTTIKNYKGNPVISPNETNGLLEVSELMVFHIRPHPKKDW